MMSLPFGYEPIAPTTWAYLSSLLMLSLFFKFHRFWSVRNLDLFLVILLSPGLLMVYYGADMRKNADAQAMLATSPSQLHTAGEAGESEAAGEQAAGQDNSAQTDASAQSDDDADAQSDIEQLTVPQVQARQLERRGYLLLFAVGAMWMARMLLDTLLRRKPLLEPNLTVGGLTFMAMSFMVFLFANIASSKPAPEDLYGPRSAVRLVKGQAEDDVQQLAKQGPGYALLHLFPIIPTFVGDAQLRDGDADQPGRENQYEAAAKFVAIISQIAIVLGMVFVGYRHFGSFGMGIGMAIVYLMSPYTWMMTGRVLHVLPAALLIWAVALYRRPGLAGVFLGLAAGVAYYPLFLIPLWVSFYLRRGLVRFVFGLVLSILLVVASLFLTSQDSADFFWQLRSIFGFWLPHITGLEGIWALGWNTWFRVPLLVGFVALCVTFVFWPAKKNFGVLVACSCAAMIAVQFWHGFGGGLYMAWYLPLALMIFFRPNLDDQQAEQVVRQVKWRREPKSAPTGE